MNIYRGDNEKYCMRLNIVLFSKFGQNGYNYIISNYKKILIYTPGRKGGGHYAVLQGLLDLYKIKQTKKKFPVQDSIQQPSC